MKRFSQIVVLWVMMIITGGRLSPVAADTNFYTTLHTTYTVNNQGVTTVSHLIKLTNKTPTLYARQYALKISSPSITKVTVKNNDQVIPAEVVTTTNQTSIGITFPDQIVGEGKSRTIEISYQNPDSSLISGKVLEVLVPKLASANEYDEYYVTLFTPKAYGNHTRTTPASTSTGENATSIITAFQPQNGESVTTLFGSSQVFKLNLRYHLENTGPNPGLAQIALPPDTLYQKLQYETLDPEPQKIEADPHGNWIATYEIPAQSTTTVNTVARALVTLAPNPQRPQPPVDDTYLKTAEYWDSRDQMIVDLADQYRTPREMYTFVVNELSYDYSRLAGETERLGAVAALAEPNRAMCQEFTDVFIALARANQIPARRLTGYAHTENSVFRPLGLVEDILHAWPEYYDPEQGTWVQIDPTWGNTTGGINYFDQFDLNHVVFAINGTSSTAPYPAGSYKLADISTKDVEVIFERQFPTITPQFKVSTEPQKLLGLAIPGFQQLVITNTTGQAWYNIDINVMANDSEIEVNRQQAQISQILPFQTVIIPFTGYSNQAIWDQTASAVVEIQYVDDQTEASDQPLPDYEVTFEAGGQGLKVLTHPFLLPALGALSLGSALIAGGLLVYRRK